MVIFLDTFFLFMNLPRPLPTFRINLINLRGIDRKLKGKRGGGGLVKAESRKKGLETFSVGATVCISCSQRTK